MIIYCVTNEINGKKYIGQTIHSLNYRKKQHLNSAKNYRDNCRLLNRAIRKYGEESFRWEVIDTATSQNELNNLESYYIELFNTTDVSKGYNLKGGGIKPYLSDETKRKISEAQIGSKNHMYGRKGSDNPTSKKVYNVTDNIVYDSATLCAKALGLELTKICAVCRGERASTGNKVFRYIINGEIQEITPKTFKKTKRVINVDTNEIFESAADAERKYYGNKNGSITKACKEGIYRRGYWKYLDD